MTNIDKEHFLFGRIINLNDISKKLHLFIIKITTSLQLVQQTLKFFKKLSVATSKESIRWIPSAMLTEKTQDFPA